MIHDSHPDQESGKLLQRTTSFLLAFSLFKTGVNGQYFSFSRIQHKIPLPNLLTYTQTSEDLRIIIIWYFDTDLRMHLALTQKAHKPSLHYWHNTQWSHPGRPVCRVIQYWHWMLLKCIRKVALKPNSRYNTKIPLQCPSIPHSLQGLNAHLVQGVVEEAVLLTFTLLKQASSIGSTGFL